MDSGGGPRPSFGGGPVPSDVQSTVDAIRRSGLPITRVPPGQDGPGGRSLLEASMEDVRGRLNSHLQRYDQEAETIRSALLDLRREIGIIKSENRFQNTLRHMQPRGGVTSSTSERTDQRDGASTWGGNSSNAGEQSALVSLLERLDDLSNRLEKVEQNGQAAAVRTLSGASAGGASEGLEHLRSELRQEAKRGVYLQDRIEQLETRERIDAAGRREQWESLETGLRRLEAARADLARRVEDQGTAAMDVLGRVTDQERRSKELEKSLQQESGLAEVTSRIEDGDRRIRELQQRADEAGLAMSRLHDEFDRKLADSRQDQMAETIALRGRVEANDGAWVTGLQADIELEQSRRAAAVHAVHARLEAVEQRCNEQPAPDVSGIVSRLEQVERELASGLTASSDLSADTARSQTEELRKVQAQLGVLQEDCRTAAVTTAREEVERLAVSLETTRAMEATSVSQQPDVSADVRALLGDLQGLGERLTALETTSREGSQRRPPRSVEDEEEAAFGGVTSMDQSVRSTSGAVAKAKAGQADEIAELRAALAETCSGLATLAHDFAQVREEHTYAITNVGDLTEFVAKSAATSIQRAETRFEQEFAAKRKELDAAAGRQAEMTSKAMALLEAAAAAGSSGDGTTSSSSGEIFALGRTLGEQAAQLKQEVAAKIDNVSTKLRDEISGLYKDSDTLRAEVSKKVASTEDYISVVERTLSAEFLRLKDDVGRYQLRLEGASLGDGDADSTVSRNTSNSKGASINNMRQSKAYPDSASVVSAESTSLSTTMPARSSSTDDLNRRSTQHHYGPLLSAVPAVTNPTSLLSTYPTRRSPSRFNDTPGAASGLGGPIVPGLSSSALARMFPVRRTSPGRAVSPGAPAAPGLQQAQASQHASGLKAKLQDLIYSVHQTLGELATPGNENIAQQAMQVSPDSRTRALRQALPQYATGADRQLSPAPPYAHSSLQGTGSVRETSPSGLCMFGQQRALAREISPRPRDYLNNIANSFQAASSGRRPETSPRDPRGSLQVGLQAGEQEALGSGALGSGPLGSTSSGAGVPFGHFDVSGMAVSRDSPRTAAERAAASGGGGPFGGLSVGRSPTRTPISLTGGGGRSGVASRSGASATPQVGSLGAGNRSPPLNPGVRRVPPPASKASPTAARSGAQGALVLSGNSQRRLSQ
eukprot:TRINITY_DN34001_c0_g2_i1.p1 TRINITY_DN34001_c0_g2~~TRINITY_DN34001_c0_g2_i1.p1  ORF type:complete len:1171 (-),score=264.41 TRINITY_DN34001_c0_g2_i1:163-3675(-)